MTILAGARLSQNFFTGRCLPYDEMRVFQMGRHMSPVRSDPHRVPDRSVEFDLPRGACFEIGNAKRVLASLATLPLFVQDIARNAAVSRDSCDAFVMDDGNFGDSRRRPTIDRPA